VANARGDFRHKLSRRLVDENQAIIVETLAVKNMLKNRKLARAISDAGWSSLLLKIAYKAECAGKHIVKLDRWAATPMLFAQVLVASKTGKVSLPVASDCAPQYAKRSISDSITSGSAWRLWAKSCASDLLMSTA
jgi:IS605 OrfB family transposase